MRSRRTHFLKFVYDMKWTDDITGATLSRRRMYLEMACYAMHLGSGSNLVHKAIKAATVRQYLSAVASFLQLFDPLERDYRRVNNSDKFYAPRRSRLSRARTMGICPEPM
jgi:hypothetical protein